MKKKHVFKFTCKNSHEKSQGISEEKQGVHSVQGIESILTYRRYLLLLSPRIHSLLSLSSGDTAHFPFMQPVSPTSAQVLERSWFQPCLDSCLPRDRNITQSVPTGGNMTYDAGREGHGGLGPEKSSAWCHWPDWEQSPVMEKESILETVSTSLSFSVTWINIFPCYANQFKMENPSLATETQPNIEHSAIKTVWYWPSNRQIHRWVHGTRENRETPMYGNVLNHSDFTLIRERQIT